MTAPSRHLIASASSRRLSATHGNRGPGAGTAIPVIGVAPQVGIYGLGIYGVSTYGAPPAILSAGSYDTSTYGGSLYA